MTRVALMSDVDGVWNAELNYVSWDPDGRRSALVNGYTIRWNRGLSEAMNELLTLGARPVWLTTWRNDARDKLAPVFGWGADAEVMHPGLNEEAYTTFPSIEWKMDAIKLYYAANPGPWLHVDDEYYSSYHDPFIKAFRDWAREHEGLVVAPDPYVGISREDIEKMAAFIKAHQ